MTDKEAVKNIFEQNLAKKAHEHNLEKPHVNKNINTDAFESKAEEESTVSEKVASEPKHEDAKPTEPVVAAVQAEAKVEEVAAKVEAEAPVANKYVKPERELTQGERKCRKALQKLGMKECDGYTRITLKKKDGVIFVMNDPDVFRSSEKAYVCFGELKIEDPNQRAHDDAAKRF